MSKFEDILRNWINRLKNTQVYITSFVATFIVILLLIIASALLLLPAIASFLVYKSIALSGLFLVLWLVSTVYIGQILIAAIIRRFEDSKIGHLDAVFSVIKDKVFKMGSATILYFIILGIIGVVGFAPLSIGIITKAIWLIIFGAIWLVLASIGAMVFGYFMWLIPVVAYKEEKIVDTLHRSFEIMKKAGWTGVTIFFISLIVGWAVSMIANVIFRIPLELTVGIAPMGIHTFSPLILVFGALWFIGIFLASAIVQVVYIGAQVTVYSSVVEKAESKPKRTRVNKKKQPTKRRSATRRKPTKRKGKKK